MNMDIYSTFHLSTCLAAEGSDITRKEDTGPVGSK